MGLFSGISNAIKGAVASVSGSLGMIAPFAMFIPGLQWLTPVMLGTQLLNGIMQGQPMPMLVANLVGGALPFGLGKALKAFKVAFPNGGSPLEFAKFVKSNTLSHLDDVAKKIVSGRGEFRKYSVDQRNKALDAIKQAKDKIHGDANFERDIAEHVSKATGQHVTQGIVHADQLASKEQLGSLQSFIDKRFGSVSDVTARAKSQFTDAIPPLVASADLGDRVKSDAPTQPVSSVGGRIISG